MATLEQHQEMRAQLVKNIRRKTPLDPDALILFPVTEDQVMDLLNLPKMPPQK